MRGIDATAPDAPVVLQFDEAARLVWVSEAGRSLVPGLGEHPVLRDVVTSALAGAGERVVEIHVAGRPARAHVMLPPGEDGRPVHALVVLRDGRLPEHPATAAVPGLQYEIDLATGEVWRSAGLHELLGLSQQDVPASVAGWGSRMHPEDVPAAEEAFHRLTESRQNSLRLGYRMRHESGRWVDVIDHASVIRGPDGRATRIVGTTLDVSSFVADRRAAEQATAALRAELAERERLASIIAHDLRSPLGAALLWVEALARAADAEVAGRARRVRDVLRRASRTVEELVDVERLRRHTSTALCREPMDLAQLTAEICDELLATRPDGELSLHAHGDTTGAWDRARVARVIGNLVGNALVHGRGAPVSVEVVGEGELVRIAVHNATAQPATAVGPSIFEPFRRGTTKGEGLGLGLYIAREIVHAHGGTLDGRSGDGRTTFVAVLPRTRPTPDPRPPAVSAAAGTG